jgi:hypothetical protein
LEELANGFWEEEVEELRLVEYIQTTEDIVDVVQMIGAEPEHRL